VACSWSLSRKCDMHGRELPAAARSGEEAGAKPA
jgi:hypothetical protein